MNENVLSLPVGGAEIMNLAQMSPDSAMGAARQVLELMVGYKELRMMYACALGEMRTKFEVLNAEFNVRYRRNPINFISTRLKSNQNILKKMQRRPFMILKQNAIHMETIG